MDKPDIDGATLQWLLGQVQAGASPEDVVGAMVGAVDGSFAPVAVEVWVAVGVAVPAPVVCVEPGLSSGFLLQPVIAATAATAMNMLIVFIPISWASGNAD